MSKLSLTQRQEKREKLVAKYAKKFAELKAVVRKNWPADSFSNTGGPPSLRRGR